MRPEKEIKARYRDDLYAMRSKRLTERLSRAPCNCVHNYLEPEERSLGIGEGIRLCLIGAEDIQNWQGAICDTVENAKTCPFYEAKSNRSEVLEEFHRDTEDPDWLAENAPNLQVLIWVLEQQELYKEGTQDAVVGPLKRVPWYMKIARWLSPRPPGKTLELEVEDT